MFTSRSFMFVAALLFLLFSSSLFAQGPVAWYLLDGNAADASGNGLDGLVKGAVPTTDRFGHPGAALSFTAAERDHIIVRASEALSFGTHDFTITTWVKFCGEQTEYAGIVCKGPPNNSYPGYQLHIGSGDKITTQIGDEGNWADERRGTLSLNDGRWHFLSVVVSPTLNIIRQYVDGMLVTPYVQVYTQRGPLNVSRFDPTPLLIGTERNFDRFFDGAIDDVRLYNRVLSHRDILTLYHEDGWTGEEAAAPGPVAYYPFNGNANDASGNGLDGVVNGAMPTFDRFGNCNSAYAFNGEEREYIAVRHNSLLAFGERDFTAAAWVKFCKEQPTYAGIVCKGPPNNSYPGYQLHIADNSRFTTQIGDEENWADEQRGYDPLNDGAWHLLVVAVSPQANTIVQYIDGRPVTSYQQVYTQRGPLSVSRFDPTPLLIGTERNFDRFFTGIIDDVRLYDHVLSQCEIDALYHENGWTGERPLPEPEITVTGPTTLREGEETRLSVACYPDVLWSTGETGNELVATRPGTYTAVVSDGSGCGGREVSVTIEAAPCRDSLLYTLCLPYRCVGSLQRVLIPVRNTRERNLSITRIEMLSGGAYVEFVGSLPATVRPGETISLPFDYRWLAEEEQRSVIRIVTAGGQTYLVELKSKGESAYGPIFNLSHIRIENCADSLGACIAVTNVTGLAVTFTSASWGNMCGNFELISPALPFQVGPGQTVRLCVRYTGRSSLSENVLILGGEGVDRYGEYSECVVHRFCVRLSSNRDHITIGGNDDPPLTGGKGGWIGGNGNGGGNGSGNVSGVTDDAALLSATDALRIYPNPVGEEASATFVLARPGRVTLELFNGRGEKVWMSLEDVMESGTQSVRVGVRDLPSGVYVLRVSDGVTLRTAAMVVRR